MINNNFIYIIFVFLITIIIAYLFGLTLVNLIDDRLSKINLNIPKQDILIKYPKEDFDNQNNENKNFNNENKEYKINTNFDSDYYNQMMKDNKIEGFSNKPDDSYKNWNIDKKKIQTCIKDHSHKKDGKDINCNY